MRERRSHPNVWQGEWVLLEHAGSRLPEGSGSSRSTRVPGYRKGAGPHGARRFRAARRKRVLPEHAGARRRAGEVSDGMGWLKGLCVSAHPLLVLGQLYYYPDLGLAPLVPIMPKLEQPRKHKLTPRKYSMCNATPIKKPVVATRGDRPYLKIETNYGIYFWFLPQGSSSMGSISAPSASSVAVEPAVAVEVDPP